MATGKTGNIEKILEKVRDGELRVEEAKHQLKTFDALGFATIDLHRERRQGFPEIIYGEGKTAEQIVNIVQSLRNNSVTRILATRVSKEKAQIILSKIPELTYNSLAKTLSWKDRQEQTFLYPGYCAVICAGTSDLAVAEEAVVTLESMGCRVERIHDVGVAGLHRLLHHLELIQGATVSVVIAGMEGALPSAVGGLVSHPVIAVPTSVGYGANFGGLSALLSMINSCASGISVVNIDNGFGGGYNAGLIHRMIHQER
ncbi:nickel pincer cofactor biosynthesis protein LarB [Bacillus pinisoli]|uniref:nickel pincer cofactor biosynthesis protein LarB n=1 Tax=Bacillus pinisoli TaxID=2901866 RepID=UPI001FF36D1A|nr:nickel pincer cofactor biosynthesis protein LarB [Bacillus pinisoli]